METDFRDAFIFSSENIKANHQGQLTEQQKTKMRDMRLYSSIGSLLGVVILAVFMMYFLIDLGKGLDSITLISIEGLLAAILILVCAYGIARWYVFTDDINIGHVAYVSGNTVVRSYRGGKSVLRHYKIITDGMSWEISSEVAKRLETNQEYKLYYAQKTKFLLSIEAI